MSSHEVIWPDKRVEAIDAVIWCTGFRPALDHLEPLGLEDAAGRIATVGSRVPACAGLWLMGYGNWTGAASATLIGVGRAARAAAEEIGAYLESQ